MTSYHSDSVKEIAAALAKAQALITNAPKRSMNSHFEKPYADLADVWSVCRGPLSANALSVAQLPRVEDKIVTVRTMLMHSSGEWIASDTSCPAERLSAQGVVSMITYLRRAGLAAMVGVAPGDDDDDGERGEGRGDRDDQGYGRGDRQYDRRPPDDRRPPENDRPPSDRPAPSRAGDHAAAAQTGVEQHRGEPVRIGEPVRSGAAQLGAHVAMARDFEARAATAPDLTALYEEITESALPGEMKRAPILAIVLRVFGLVDSVNDLNAWGNIAAKAKLGELYRAQLDAGYDAALVRLGRMAPPIAAE